MASFSADITEFVEKTKLRGDLVIRKIAFDLLRGVMLKSPVDTGRFRVSWRVGINRTDLGTAAPRLSTRTSPLPAPPPFSAEDESHLRRNEALILKAKFGDTVNISNNVPYAGELERGKSRGQAPHGVLALTLAEEVAKFQFVVKQVRQQTGNT